MKKRLFLFAAYDKSGQASDALLWYLKSLSRFGDVVLVADSAMEDEQMERLSDVCLHAEAQAHGEYDFGSYKRAFAWASQDLALSSYDYLYLVNDSVYGPLFELDTYFYQMEAMGTPAFSFVFNPHRRNPHLQSWFVGMDRSVFTASWFADFLLSVRGESSKIDVCVKYEHGLTQLLMANSVQMDALLKLPGKSIYNSVKKLFLMDFPFVKKAAFTRHKGSLGAQLSYVLDRVPEECRDMILEDAGRIYGKAYVDKLLTRNPLVIAARYLSYLCTKLGLRRIS